jgi:hypothetical protein
MNKTEHEALKKLAERWVKIADRLENQPVTMTANTHRLFANELLAVLSRIGVDTPWYRRVLNNIMGRWQNGYAPDS